MTADWTVAVVVILFLATLIRSAFGFGEALVAVPLLALVMPVEVAAPLATLTSITVAAVVLVQDWSEVHVRSAGQLVLATVFGIPLGLMLLTQVVEPVVKSALAVVIIGFSSYSLWCRRAVSLKDDRWAWLFGFGAGALGGAYGMNGPPLVIYGSLRGWSPQHFRATLQGYFLPASMMGMGGYWLAGLWTAEVTRCFLVSLPTVVVAVATGRVINRRMRGPRFLVCIHAGLVAIGVVLLAQALSGGASGESLPAEARQRVPHMQEIRTSLRVAATAQSGFRRIRASCLASSSRLSCTFFGSFSPAAQS